MIQVSNEIKEFFNTNAEYINKDDLKGAVSRIPFEISYNDRDFIIFLLGYILSPTSFVRVISSTFSWLCHMGLEIGDDICLLKSWYAKGSDSNFDSIYYTTSLIERGVSSFCNRSKVTPEAIKEIVNNAPLVNS